MSRPTGQPPAEKGEENQAVGRLRGGRASKIRVLADHRGRPVAFTLTPGNLADISITKPLMDAVAAPKLLSHLQPAEPSHIQSTERLTGAGSPRDMIASPETTPPLSYLSLSLPNEQYESPTREFSRCTLGC